MLATASAMPKTIAADQSQPNRCATRRAQRGRDGALSDRAGNGDAPHRQQFLQMELQADAEHQQDDADLGELLGEMSVGDEARRVRADAQSPPGDIRRSARDAGVR